MDPIPADVEEFVKENLQVITLLRDMKRNKKDGDENKKK